MPWVHVPCAAGSPLWLWRGASPFCPRRSCLSRSRTGNALLLSGQGRTGELKQLAAELMAVFSAQEIHREATAALVLFQRACEEDRGTSELIARLAALLRRKGQARGRALKDFSAALK
ncbi:MAG TPA: hypothetical protein VF414_00530 [Thermoanaerobaculia bacterium]